jgi:uncharacterized membrane-anchored protein YhcB (DUF1043 family)
MTPDSGSATQKPGGETAQHAVERAQEAVGDATDTAMAKAKTELDQRTTQVGGQVAASADALRTTGEQLRQQGNQTVAQMTDEAARQAQRLGRYLEEADGDRLVADVERYARQNPWAVIVGGVLVGAAAARFLKASSTQRYQQLPRTARADAPASRPASSFPAATGPTTAGDLADRRAAGGV